MRCVIPCRGVKLFGKAVQCLAKIGEELYLEGLLDALTLRTVNSARSAFACISFHQSFFQHYTLQSSLKCGHQTDESESPPDVDEAYLRCKIAAKSCLTVFRSLSSLEKTVDRCTIELDVPDSRLVFILHCKHGITKTYNLGFQECETLQAVFAKDLCVNAITAQGKVLQDVVANFVTSLEEVTMTAAATELSFKNYVEDEPDPSKALLTETSLQPGEFDSYCVGVESSLTFCLKELRAILALLEATGQPVTMHFDSGGKPIVFSIDSDVTYEADFVLATIQEQAFDPSQTVSQSVLQAAPKATQGQDLAAKRSSTQLTSSRVRKPRANMAGMQTASTDRSESEWPDDLTCMHSRDEDGLSRPLVSTGKVSNYKLSNDEDNFSGTVSIGRHVSVKQETGVHLSTQQPASLSGLYSEESLQAESSSLKTRTQAGGDVRRTHPEAARQDSCPLSGLSSSFSSGVRGFNVAPPAQTPPILRPSSSFNALQSPITPLSTTMPSRGVCLPVLGDSEGGTPSDWIEPSPHSQSGMYSLSGGHSQQPHSLPPSFDLTKAVADDDPGQNDSGGEELDTVPGTPPKKKFCSLFFGAKSLGLHQAHASSSEVLAEDTDEESD